MKAHMMKGMPMKEKEMGKPPDKKAMKKKMAKNAMLGLMKSRKKGADESMM